MLVSGALLHLVSAMLLLAEGQNGTTPLQRFLARGEEPTVEYRALRRLEAHNPKFNQSAWMTAWTEYDRVNGFRFTIVAEGGSGYVRSKVLRAALEGEQKIWASNEPQNASLTHENYTFDAGEPAPDGLVSVAVKPRRKDLLLVEGSIFVQPRDGDLARIEGRLSKTPSFWTRRVDVVRRYERLAGVRVPVSIESVAHVLIAGRSTFKMTYEYETINGQRVGNPQPNAATID
ncbi:MAG TPA: hypothetical protein VKD69_24300 [Vicinamibacterales bacterium]|nr:hypothetical protein [Vicinamibacterales bacterium]